VKPRLLDLFCGAGGAGMGYHLAGFDVVGVDINPQPRYPFEFHQADALTYPLVGFDAIHASPPCEGYSSLNIINGRSYPMLIDATRDLLAAAGGPYVIENVAGAPLLYPLTLCGSSFGLRVRRHRLFESNVWLLGQPCQHGPEPSARVYGLVDEQGRAKARRADIAAAAAAMGINWMTPAELAKAIPPAYTRFIGEQLMSHLRQVAA
jgi:DNA (cytosine-5)-methyltransferase 1